MKMLLLRHARNVPANFTLKNYKFQIRNIYLFYVYMLFIDICYLFMYLIYICYLFIYDIYLCYVIYLFIIYLCLYYLLIN